MIGRKKCQKRMEPEAQIPLSFGHFRVATLAVIGAVVTCMVFLWWHAQSYDFFTDDAYITLRFGQNLWRHGAPVYNIGQRVEGYTSPLWMLLTAFAHAFASPTKAVQTLGLGAAIGWMLGLYKLYILADSDFRVGATLVLLATAMSCPVAAWTMGGLETPLFGALITLSLVQGARVVRYRSRVGSAVLLGIILFAATMTRPEGMIVSAFIFGAWLIVQRRQTHLKSWLAACGVYGAMTGAHVLWRLSYYGYLFPNTYYIKSSGSSDTLLAHGLKYAHFAATEMSWGFVALLATAIVFPWSLVSRVVEAQNSDDNARAMVGFILVSIKLLCIFFVLYVVRVGGDFLDLYRFWAPVLPLGFFLIMLGIRRLTALKWRTASIAAGLASCLLIGHGYCQYELWQKARLVSESGRAKHSIEPIGWSRLYALRWAAMGRWIHQQAAADDWMAVGAAGAMPYYAGIANIDLLGLCDEFVAHVVPATSSRPGHQKYAPLDYVLKQRPTFLFMRDFTADAPVKHLSTELEFRQAGYQLVEAHLTPELHGSPTHVYHYFYMRQDRVKSLQNRPYFRIH